MSRNIYDSSGLATLEEKVIVRIRRGKFRGQCARVTYIRRSTGHPRIYVQLLSGRQGTWLAPRSVDVVS